jgi:hypothetical protein
MAAKVGRPSSYSEDIAGEILTRLAEGEPLTKICADAHMPNPSTVFNWERIVPGFSEKVTRARECSADHYSHEIVEIAEENPRVEIPTKCGSYEATDAAGVQRNRLRIDTRVKLMQMLKRKTYGDKVAHTGEDGGPIQFVVTRAGKK